MFIFRLSKQMKYGKSENMKSNRFYGNVCELLLHLVVCKMTLCKMTRSTCFVESVGSYLSFGGQSAEPLFWPLLFSSEK